MFNPHRTTSSAHTTPTLRRLMVFVLMLALLLAANLRSPISIQAGNLYQNAAPIPETSDPDAIVPDAADLEDRVDPNAGFDPDLGADTPLTVPIDIPAATTPGAESSDEDAPAPVLGAEVTLPDLGEAWGDAATLNVAELAAQFENLLRIETNGDFAFTYLAGVDGASIRILPLEDVWPANAPLYLELAWRLDGDSPLALPAGMRVDMELSARLYSPPAGAVLNIREEIAGEWQSSSVTMQDIQWQTYAVARQVADNATRVEIGIRWLPELPNAWIEIQMPRLILGREDVVAGALTPNDTPTPVPTSAPDVPPTPEATPTPEPTPTLEPTPTPLPSDDLTGTPDAEVAAAVDDAVEEDAEEDAKADGEEDGEAQEELLPTSTLTPHVVTSTPTPVDVFEEATRVAQATAWAPVVGTVTPTPENMVTQTPSPTPIVIIVTNTPVPQNAATAIYNEHLATAVAFTTGTPTPLPAEAQVLVATNTPAPQPRPTNTPTPLFILLNELPPTAEPQPTAAFPPILQGKIMFLSDFRATTARPNVLIMNPDGSDLAIMGSRLFYNRAVAREPYSTDRRFLAFVQREGTDGNGRWLQIKFDDYHYDARGNAMTFFGSGNSWSPVWSPTRQSVAFVSNESGNDEIYLVNMNEWPAIQLTNNAWEWDHHPSFSPDGGQIVFSSNRNTGTRQIWIMDASGGNQQQLTNFPFEAWNPVWVKYPDS